MKKLLIGCVLFFIAPSLQAQIGLGITTPHPNAYFQVNSTNKGILLPRMTAIQRLAIAPNATANGLLVFDTDSSAFMFWTGTNWRKMSSSLESELWKKTGNDIYNGNSGRVGIGTNNPVAKLHVADSSVVFGSNSIFSGFPVPNPPVSGEGTRMMWYAELASFRAGAVTDNSWDRDSTGLYSAAFGYNTRAYGLGSLAVGSSTSANAGGFASGVSAKAYGYNSVATGFLTLASGASSVAFNTQTAATGENAFASGKKTLASGYQSFASGEESEATGIATTAMGFKAHASGNYAMAIGEDTYASFPHTFAGGYLASASGNYAFAYGNNALANGEGAVAFGNFTFTGRPYSFAAGNNLYAKCQGCVALGEFNDDGDNPSATPAYNDRIFQLGNGSASSRSNAITVLRNGSVGINNLNPFYNLDVTGTGQFTYDMLVGRNASVGNNFFVTGNSQLQGNLDVFGNTEIYGKARVGHDLIVGDTIYTRYLQLNGPTPISPGMVMTSDLYGNCTWQFPASATSYWSINGNDIYSNNPGNVGIGTTTPGSPLSFSNAVGNKISLWGNDPNYNYGFGIQGGLLQIHAASTVDNIGFGFGASNNFTERMRIQGDGKVGIGNSNPNYLLDVGNRMRIRSGGDVTTTAGVWLNNEDNSQERAFIGMQNDNSVGFYSINTGWSLTMDIGTGKTRIADGSQGDGKVLTSDANGYATWQNTNANKSAVLATFPSTGGVNLTTAAGNAYTNLYIDLPPGKWIVIATYLMAQGGASLTSGQSMFVRTFFSSSPSAVISTGDNIGSGLISGHIAYPTPFAIISGQNVLNNTSGATKRYYVWANMSNTGGQPTGFFLNNFCGSFWSENNLVAIPMN